MREIRLGSRRARGGTTPSARPAPALAGTPFPAGSPAADASPSQPEPYAVTERVLAEIRAGGTIPAVAHKTGTSEVFVKVLVDHLARTGLSGTASSLCSSGQGACGSEGAQTEAALISCAGCAFAK
ncbi:hypothetical protein INS90_01980 [Trueperella pecoris]|uniref:Uncharacterized protein n=1 Tax=Trueperella pecoris TaxID=2733571 RepID=A0A7M1R1C1_9ACTO|nr:hypothetical protein [Trueperella pecoris]QOR48089.1 hypothetical protein INS90_01980 [Trueperella pecoris]